MVAAGDYRPHFQLTHDNVASNVKKLDDNPRTPVGGPARAIAAAKKAVELSAVPGKATGLEKLYIAAIAARRNPDSKDPDGDYIKGLRAVVAAYPKEVEAKTYLALHLMQGFSTPDKQAAPGSMEAVAILRELLVSAPPHGCTTTSFTASKAPASPRTPGRAVADIPSWLPISRMLCICRGTSGRRRASGRRRRTRSNRPPKTSADTCRQISCTLAGTTVTTSIS